MSYIVKLRLEADMKATIEYVGVMALSLLLVFMVIQPMITRVADSMFASATLIQEVDMHR